MQLDPRAIQIHIDGSCYHNPGGEAGCAAMVHYPDHLQLTDETIVDFGCAESSNNRMELMACIKALKWVRETQPWPNVTRIQIVSDSKYVTENAPYRAAIWKKQGWRNRDGKPMANDDLWEKLISARAKASRNGLRIDLGYEPGKTSSIGKMVDRAAKAAAKRGGIDEDHGYRPGAVSRSMVKSGVAQAYPAQGQSEVIWPYAKKIMFKGENRISFNIYDEMAQAFAAKFYAFATQLVAAEVHRNHAQRVLFNSDPQYPQILQRIEEVPVRKASSSHMKKRNQL